MSSLRRFFRDHLAPHVGALLGGALLLQVAGLFQSFMVLTLKFVFDESFGLGGAPGKALERLSLLTDLKDWLLSLLPPASALRDSTFFVPGLLVSVFLLKGVFTYSGTMVMVRCGIRATQALRERLLERTLAQEPSFFTSHPVGDLMQRCIGDVAQVQGIASNQLAEAVKEVAIAIAMLATVLTLNWKLTLWVFVAVPIVVFPIQGLSRRIRKINRRNMEASGRLLSRLKEVFSNIRVVIGFSRERYEVERFHHQQHDLYRLGIKAAQASAASHPIMELVGGLLLATILLLVSGRIRSGEIKGSDFVVYLMALYAFYDPIRRLTRLNNDFQTARSALDRIYSLMDREPLLTAPANPRPVPVQPEELRFEGVQFAYDAERRVLDGIDLSVRRGETVALVGGSGGGKTTLVNLVPRFFDPTGGRITLDGTDLRDFDPHELRRRIGIVTQETLLFMDSIHDNIAYGQEASREAVIEAARRAQAHDFVVALPRGYDTPLAETGSSVSGGQRQRLAIARALLQDPPILILDEATSALDTESERAVQEALEALMKDRTTLVIAHRLSTIQRASRICVLRRGRIVEEGTHERLLALEGEYARLYRLQFADE